MRALTFRAALSLATFVALPTCALALDPGLAPTQYVRTHWGRAEGLPDTSVFAIEQTRDGYLWFGTETGRVRFDGVRFAQYSSRTVPAFETSLVTCFRETRDGALIIGTRSGVIEYRAGEFRPLERPGRAEEKVTREAAAGGTAEATFQFNGKRRRYAPVVEDGLLRITQEAVGNASRHAGASHIRMTLAAVRTEVTLTIEDDGKGFGPDSVVPGEEGGYGLRGIRERVTSMKGTFDLKTGKGEGTRIVIRVPGR